MFFTFGRRGHVVNLAPKKAHERIDAPTARPCKSVDEYRVLFERERARANEERSRAERLEKALKDALSDLAQAEHQFKNFHRNLCSRFDYFHDEVDWKRDQVSLEEWVAKRVAAAPTSST